MTLIVGSGRLECAFFPSNAVCSKNVMSSAVDLEELSKDHNMDVRICVLNIIKELVVGGEIAKQVSSGNANVHANDQVELTRYGALGLLLCADILDLFLTDECRELRLKSANLLEQLSRCQQPKLSELGEDDGVVTCELNKRLEFAKELVSSKNMKRFSDIAKLNEADAYYGENPLSIFVVDYGGDAADKDCY